MFIKSNYYKIVYPNNIYYLKVIDVKNFRVYTSNYYINNGVYVLTDNTSSFVISDIENNNVPYYKVDINEFVDFLPSDNIDKKNYIRQVKIKFLLEKKIKKYHMGILFEELIIGNYYKVIIDDDIYMFKLRSLYNQRLMVDSFYIKNYNYFEDYGANINDGHGPYIYEEIIFNDIVAYFPDNHPDKKQYMRKLKIKTLLNG